ncbi:MAG TPA: TIGR03943 family protein, partial [Anaerolinea sp.]|nr:TIGR03943 family protein [Anaerolinea sp.]
YRTLQALILAGLGIFFLVRIGDGRILLYINQRFVFLVLLGAIGLLAIAQVVMRSRPAAEHDDLSAEEHAHHDHAHDQRSGLALWVIALPLLVGVLLPARPLGSLAAATRGMNTNAPLTAGSAGGAQVNDLPSDQRSVLDWLRLFEQTSDPATLSGQAADVTGFIYHDIRLEGGQFMVARFSLTCCVADATAIGMVVAWPEAGKLPDNQWVRVRGPVETGQVEGKAVPLIRAQSVESIPQPEQPYLFP